MKYTCIVIDDEPHCAELLKDYVGQSPQLKLLMTITDPLKAFHEIAVIDRIDFIFLDILMPSVSGLNLAQYLRATKKCKFIIFTTGHAKYELQAITSAIDVFLLKPISVQKFNQVVSVLIKQLEAADEKSDTENHFYINDVFEEHRKVKIMYKEIIAVESISNYVRIHTADNVYKYHCTTKAMEEKLVGKGSLIRVQRSFIIATDFIEGIEDGRTLIVLKKGSLKVRIGRSYKKEFKKYISTKKF